MNYRETKSAYLNCEKRMYAAYNPYNIPYILPQDVDLSNPQVIGFNYALGEKHPEDKIVHFFLDDYQFRRVWDDPNRYLPILKRFKAVLAPDFSMYADFPKAVQIFNHYRKHWCARYWQDNGIKVIPVLSWSTPESFEWCFDGTPEDATVCISTVGGFHSNSSKQAWLAGYEEALRRLHPSRILLFGKQFPEIQFDGDLVVVDNSNLTNKSTKSAKPGKEDLDKNPQPVL